jgi:transposase InsO family protein
VRFSAICAEIAQRIARSKSLLDLYRSINAPMESFYATLKGELVEQRDYLTHAEARADVFQFLEGWYNRRRLHSALGYLTPEQKVAAFQAAASAAQHCS